MAEEAWVPADYNGLVGTGCTVLPGYEGKLFATTNEPFYMVLHDNSDQDATLTPIQCPDGSTGFVPGSDGTGGESGCTPKAGWAGKVVALADPPYYNASLLHGKPV